MTRAGKSTMLILLGGLGCGGPPDPGPGDAAADRPAVTPEALKRRGFVKGENGVWEAGRITMGDLCDLLGCQPDDFGGSFPSSNSAFEEVGPLEYDAGQLHAEIWHRPEDTAQTEEGWNDRATVVRACVTIYDASHPRPKPPMSKSKLVQEPGVLANDTAAVGTLTASLVSDPSHGTLSYFNSDGSFQYTPASGYAGDDFFVYEITDGTGQTAEANVDISILGMKLTLQGLDPSKNTTTGGYVGINANTDNNPAAVNNFIPKKRDFTVTTTTTKVDPDLVKLNIDLSADQAGNRNPIPGAFILSIVDGGQGRIKLWSDQKKTSLILDASTGSTQRAYDYQSLPREVYVEGTNPSAATKDLTIKLTWVYFAPLIQIPNPVGEEKDLLAAVTPIVNSFTVTAPAGNPGDVGGIMLVGPNVAPPRTDPPWMGVDGVASFNAAVNLSTNTGKLPGDAHFIQDMTGIDNGLLNNTGAGLVYANGRKANELPVNNPPRTQYAFPLLDMPKSIQPNPYPYYDSGAAISHSYSETPGGSNVWTLRDGDGPSTLYQYRTRTVGYQPNLYPMVPPTLPAAATLTSVDLSYHFRLYLVVDLPAAAGSTKKVFYTLGYLDWTVNFLATNYGGGLTLVAPPAGGNAGTGVFPGTFNPTHEDPKAMTAPTANLAIYVR
jgi:hypothetical protein